MVYLRDGYRWCPHCGGQTQCGCGSCSKPGVDFRGRETLVSGICQVCKGLGQTPDK